MLLTAFGLLALVQSLLFSLTSVEATSNRAAHRTISCYTCVSKNGSDPFCEDPYHPAHSTYSESCMVPKKGHKGRFPANYCLKVIGSTSEAVEEESLVIRACSLESMGNQCGPFIFADQLLTGCILTCDYDGCNASVRLHVTTWMTFCALASAVYRQLFSIR